MLAIKFILAVVFAILALISITLVVIPAVGNNKRWKVMEPELIRDIQKSLGQKILSTILLNASESTDFSHGKGFWLWMAFTSDHIAFAHRDALTRQGEGEIYFSRRTDASLKRLEKSYTELAFKDAKTAQQWKLVVCVRPCDQELLERFIPARSDRRF